MKDIPAVSVHVSGKQVAKALEEVMGWKPYGIVRDNIAIIEAAETERMKNTAGEMIETEAAVPSELQSDDYEAPSQPEQPEVEDEQSANETPA